MKIEDCIAGVRVVLYDCSGKRMATIQSINVDGKITLNERGGYFYPQQLRKLIKKNRPEIMYAFSCDGVWAGPVFSEEVRESLKKQGKTVWLMRGVRKL